MSIHSMAAISVEQYLSIKEGGRKRSKMTRAYISVSISWMLSIGWSLPPLFGWSRYRPEGLGTTCSFDYFLRGGVDEYFLICVVCGAFVCPLCIISICYILIYANFKKHQEWLSKRMFRSCKVKHGNDTNDLCASTCETNLNQISKLHGAELNRCTSSTCRPKSNMAERYGIPYRTKRNDLSNRQGIDSSDKCTASRCSPKDMTNRHGNYNTSRCEDSVCKPNQNNITKRNGINHNDQCTASTSKRRVTYYNDKCGSSVCRLNQSDMRRCKSSEMNRFTVSCKPGTCRHSSVLCKQDVSDDSPLPGRQCQNDSCSSPSKPRAADKHDTPCSSRHCNEECMSPQCRQCLRQRNLCICNVRENSHYNETCDLDLSGRRRQGGDSSSTCRADTNASSPRRGKSDVNPWSRCTLENNTSCPRRRTEDNSYSTCRSGNKASSPLRRSRDHNSCDNASPAGRQPDNDLTSHVHDISLSAGSLSPCVRPPSPRTCSADVNPSSPCRKCQVRDPSHHNVALTSYKDYENLDFPSGYNGDCSCVSPCKSKDKDIGSLFHSKEYGPLVSACRSNDNDDDILAHFSGTTCDTTCGSTCDATWDRYVSECTSGTCPHPATTCEHSELRRHRRDLFYSRRGRTDANSLSQIVSQQGYKTCTPCICKQDIDLRQGKKVKIFRWNRMEFRIARSICFVVLLYCLSWAPYATITLIGQYGNRQNITPFVSMVTVMMAKMSTIVNPVIYGLLHPAFKVAMKRYLPRIVIGNSRNTGPTQPNMDYDISSSTSKPSENSNTSNLAMMDLNGVRTRSNSRFRESERVNKHQLKVTSRKQQYMTRHAYNLSTSRLK